MTLSDLAGFVMPNIVKTVTLRYLHCLWQLIAFL